jgi:hypothetical protein
MATVQELNESKVPIIRINKKINAFDRQILFPKKLKQANEILSVLPPPVRQERKK